MKLAAIDIGSNAVRLQVSRVLSTQGEEKLKRIEYLRFPLKLGNDVFKQQYITKASKKKLTQLLHAFKLLIDLYEVDSYMICATSALREAKNGKEITQHIQKQLGLFIHIIDGEQEAALIDKAIQPLLNEQNYIHVDVGGGSTEVSLYQKRKKIATQSFDIGTIKLLEGCNVTQNWEQMNRWLSQQTQKFVDPPLGIATGGNIRKLSQIAKKGGRKPISLKELQEIEEYLSMYSFEQRVNKLELNPDRADVILPAAKIYIAAMTWGRVKKIFVPDVSLRDGILQAVYEKTSR